MSADNYHAVIHARGRFYVVENLSASMDYDYDQLITKATSQHITRSAALEAAHDLHWTEYGVVEIRPEEAG